MSARTCASVNRSRRSSRNARPASPMRGSPRPPSPAAIETVRLPRHSAPARVKTCSLKPGRFGPRLQVHLRVDFARYGPHRQTWHRYLVRRSPARCTPSHQGARRTQRAPLASSPEWARLARARIERAPAFQSLLLGLAIAVLDEHAQERERVEMRALSRAHSPSGRFAMASSTSPQRHPWSASSLSTMTRRLSSGWNVARYERLARDPCPPSGRPGSHGSRCVIG